MLFNIFTKPEGEETLIGKTIAIIVGLIAGSGIYAVLNFISANASEGIGMSPTVNLILAVFIWIITTYEMRRRLAKKPEVDIDDVNE